MTADQIIKKRSISAINKALEDYQGSAYVEPPKKIVTSGNYKKLSRHQIDQGVIAFVHACNLSGGSVGDLDFYKLARCYLWNEEARSKINDVVVQHGF